MQMKAFNVYNNENKAVQEAYAMLTANIHIAGGSKLKTFVLTSCNPEEGKTSLAISLAIAMASSGWKVLLVDADMRKPAAAKRLNTGVNLGLADYLNGEAELEEALCATNIPNLTYLPCGNAHPNPTGLLCSLRLEELMEKVKDSYNFVLFDTPALTSVIDGGLVASKADGTILVAKMGATTLTSLKRIKEQLEKLNANILGVVLNRVKKRYYKQYFESYNYFFNPKKFFDKSKKRKKGLDLPPEGLPSQNVARF